MSCSRDSPASPRTPKIQHQSWDECYTPPISINNTPMSPQKSYEHQKNQKLHRSHNVGSLNSSLIPNFSQNDHRSIDNASEFQEVQQRSPSIIYSSAYENSSDRSNYNHSPKRRSPKSPRKFTFDAVSPRGEKAVYEPNEIDETIIKLCSTPRGSKHSNSNFAKMKNADRDFDQSCESNDHARKILNHDERHSAFTRSTISGESATNTTTTSAPCTSSNNSCCENNCPGKDNDGSIDGSSKYHNSKKRRHAINITSNPGYQTLHNSHSTLDRTCSDSIVSLRYRKSTSDLTDTGTAVTSPIVNTSHKRRGSSKGGLAYLASRKNSRDSIKSAVSNASLFSNEEIGPLIFQSTSRGRTRRTSNFLELPIPDHIRPRVCSLPEGPYNPRLSDDLYRLRTFSISKGTVVNCGDSIISRRSRSNTSVNSTNSRASERSPFDGSCCGGKHAVDDSLPTSPEDSEEPPLPPRYRIVLMGDAGVGKTALVSQFMTSEYMHTYDASLDDEFGEKTVSVLLDGEESELIFVDHPSTEMSVENSLSTYEPHGCVIVYSVVQRSSFQQAEEIINYLWRENVTNDKAVILVGNKVDLARSRVISLTEGKSLAQSRDSKFIETSSGIQHNVDELLVGILKQIRLKETRNKKTAAQTSMKLQSSRTHMSLHLAKEILQKICQTEITKSKSCENLHVL